MGRGPARIRGRGRELADLRTALATGTGRLVVVRGSAGVGRSAVLDAMARQSRADGIRMLRLGAHQDDQPDQFDDALGIALLVRTVRAEFEVFGDQRLADSLGAIVRLRDRAARHGGGWAPQLVAEFRLLFDRIVDRDRTTVLLDDAQLLGEPAPLLAAARNSGCQVLTSVQDDTDLSAGVAELLSVADHVLTLGPLAEDDVAALVRQAAGSKLDDAVLDGLRTALGSLFGNPATVLGTLANLRATGQLATVHDRLCLAVLPTEISLPAGHHLLRAAESLGELGRRLLFAVAVLDEVTVDSVALIAAALRAPVPDCGRVLDALIDRRVLVVGAGARVRCHCPALAVSVAGWGDAESATRLHADIATQLLAARQRGDRVLPVPLANHIAGSGTVVPIGADLCGWLLDLAAAAEPEAPESAAHWCAAALRRLPPTGADYAGALRSLISLVLRTGQYELLDEVLTRFARRGRPPGVLTDLRTAASLVALHTGEVPGNEEVRRLLDDTYVDDGNATFAEWWFGRPLAADSRPASESGPIRRIGVPGLISVQRIGLLLAALTGGPGTCDTAWQRTGRPALSPELSRLRDVGGLLDVGAVFTIAFGEGYHLPHNGVLGVYHRVVRGYSSADWSAAMSAACELELIGCRDTLVHHAARLFAAEICAGRRQLTAARQWLADSAPLRRLVALRAWVEVGLFEATDRRAEAVALARKVGAELGDAGPHIGLARLLMRGLRIASTIDDTEGEAALLAHLERLHGAGASGNSMEVVFAGRGLAHRDAVYTQIAADLARERDDQPALMEACLGAARFADDPWPWLLEAQEIARRCGAAGTQDRVRELTRERGVSAPRPRGQRPELQETEQRIIKLIQNGLTNRQIALELGVSEKTVEGRLSRLFARTGYRSRVKLAAASLEGRLGPVI